MLLLLNFDISTTIFPRLWDWFYFM